MVKRQVLHDRGSLQLAADVLEPDNPRGTVILLHGGGQTRHSWGQTAVDLAKNGWGVVNLDARGHGDSGWDPGGDYSLKAFTDDLVSVIRARDQQAVLVGASLGGMTALRAAAIVPNLVRALVLVDIVVDPRPEGVARVQEFMSSHLDGFASLEAAAEAVSRYNPVRERPPTPSGLRKNLRRHPDGRWRWHYDPAVIRYGDDGRRSAERQELRAAARAVRAPTLLVRGAQSDVVDDDGLAEMLRLIPHAEAIHVDRAGHMVAGDDNGSFTSSVMAFLDARLLVPADGDDPAI